MRRPCLLLAVLCLAMVAAATCWADTIPSCLGHQGPAFAAGTLPSTLGWGPDDKPYPDKFVVNPGDGSEMVWVPAGEFVMGTPAGEGWPGEHPQHHVRISKGFWLGKCTVTLGQWKAYCKKVGIEVGEASAPGDDHPVTCVNWDDAKAYCRTYGLVLPTEAQWEYAARGPENRKYPWGNAWDEDKCCNAGNKGPGGRTWPVGSFPDGVSWCGALDMAGNVWQWCKDWYTDDKYYGTSPDTDPPGPDTGEARVLRGGSWRLVAILCRSAGRGRGDPSLRDDGLGFRGSRTP